MSESVIQRKPFNFDTSSPLHRLDPHTLRLPVASGQSLAQQVMALSCVYCPTTVSSRKSGTPQRRAKKQYGNRKTPASTKKNKKMRGINHVRRNLTTKRKKRRVVVYRANIAWARHHAESTGVVPPLTQRRYILNIPTFSRLCRCDAAFDPLYRASVPMQRWE